MGWFTPGPPRTLTPSLVTVACEPGLRLVWASNGGLVGHTLTTPTAAAVCTNRRPQRAGAQARAADGQLSWLPVRQPWG
jgi:hypothetical protein